MASIFVSYRRTDAAGHAGRLYDQLANRFGAANIFKDLDSMEPGRTSRRSSRTQWRAVTP